MNRLPVIAVLSVGGTIAMTASDSGGVVPRLDADGLIAAVPALDRIARLRARTLSTLPSPHMDLETVAVMARAIEEEIAAGVDGIVLIQGTDTLEESAFALELMLEPRVPVVMTGAMRNPTLPGADGPANLYEAVRTAAQADVRGVVVVLDGRIHAPRFLSKRHTASVAAFDSDPVLLGEVTDAGPVIYANLPPLLRYGIGSRVAAPPVALLTSTMGDDGRLVDAIADAGYAGLVVAGMGGGHVSPAMAERLGPLARRLPVVLASRVSGGSTLINTYAYPGGEMDLIERGLIRAGWLSPVKARIALALLLGTGATTETLRRFFTAYGGG